MNGAEQKTNEQIHKKLSFFKDVMQKTVLNVEQLNVFGIVESIEVTNCISLLNTISETICAFEKEIEGKELEKEYSISQLQNINDEISFVFKKYGTQSIDDLLSICFGSSSTFINTDEETEIYTLLKKYFHPANYSVITIKKDDPIDPQNMVCSDVSIHTKSFHMKVHGIKVFIYNKSFNKYLSVYGVLDDAMLNIINNSYINNKLAEFRKYNENGAFERFIHFLSLKDCLTENSDRIYKKYISYMTQLKLIKQKSLQQNVKDFLTGDLFLKRNTLIQLLIGSEDNENKYMASLLYDLMANENNNGLESNEQRIIFNSFNYYIKFQFKDIIKKTIEYSNKLTNIDLNKVSLEQQICMLRTSDVVKEKAMSKMKEVKSKSDESGSKARQYLDGLLKIPFGVYVKEPIMGLMSDSKKMVKKLIGNADINSSVEIISKIKEYKINFVKKANINGLKKQMNGMDKSGLLTLLQKMNAVCNTGITVTKSETKKSILNKMYEVMVDDALSYRFLSTIESILNKTEIDTTVVQLENNFERVKQYMTEINGILDNAVYGHNKAKKQLEKIIGQWINGEQTGYCFGFEGPPGVGKTSLAKNGLSACLNDIDGKPRPFSMIQMGGDTNGSTIHGHNYTYVGSTWGGIVQILMDSKCMNPIILIDEVDKISRTEHGREIIGILTHLLDPTQNECYQDKYFSGIDLDLSKCLFILSYNDVDMIDKVLLDRIHRIKFSGLSLEDKLVILEKYLLPEIYKKMGLEGVIQMTKDVMTFIIEEYTSEAGVRKLKEVLFELIGEVNLSFLKGETLENPLVITLEDVKTRYLKDRQEMRNKKIHLQSEVGIVNGLWANAIGKGGVIPIQALYYPADSFLNLKLTGLQGDVMKESMNVALTLAWSLSNIKTREKVSELYEKKKYGVHIHCPEGSIQKDGPSAGAAITTVLYSLFNNKKIKYHFGITGEISLDGRITEIGGLDLKILGGIKSGVKSFIFPEENTRDFNLFMDKYEKNGLLNDITFYKVSHISEVFKIIFEK
jgi:ATP-dependent Lon protease